jgi:hypothetical protein
VQEHVDPTGILKPGVPKILCNVAPADVPDDRSGESAKTAWVTLSAKEALEVLEALRYWAEDFEAGEPNVGWHMHLADSDGSELTIEIFLEADERLAASD